MFDQGGRALVLADVVLVVSADEIFLGTAGARVAAHRADHCGIQRWRFVAVEKWILGEKRSRQGGVNENQSQKGQSFHNSPKHTAIGTCNLPQWSKIISLLFPLLSSTSNTHNN